MAAPPDYYLLFFSVFNSFIFCTFMKLNLMLKFRTFGNLTRASLQGYFAGGQDMLVLICWSCSLAGTIWQTSPHLAVVYVNTTKWPIHLNLMFVLAFRNGPNLGKNILLHWTPDDFKEVKSISLSVCLSLCVSVCLFSWLICCKRGPAGRTVDL